MQFNLTTASDNLAFRLMLFNLNSLAEEIREMAKKSHADVIQSFLDRTFYRWKHVPADEDRTDASSVQPPNIDAWRDDIQ